MKVLDSVRIYVTYYTFDFCWRKLFASHFGDTWSVCHRSSAFASTFTPPALSLLSRFLFASRPLSVAFLPFGSSEFRLKRKLVYRREYKVEEVSNKILLYIMYGHSIIFRASKYYIVHITNNKQSECECREKSIATLLRSVIPARAAHCTTVVNNSLVPIQ